MHLLVEIYMYIPSFSKLNHVRNSSMITNESILSHREHFTHKIVSANMTVGSVRTIPSVSLECVHVCDICCQMYV